MGVSALFLMLFFSVFLITLISATDINSRHDCVNNGNFTANSTYGTNLSLLFSHLSTTVDYNYGFYNLSVGQIPDQVNAIGLCRGDQKEDTCRSCLNEIISELKQRCPDHKEAIGWSQFCTLHYSSQQLYGSMESDPYRILFNLNNTLNVNVFNRVLSPFLTNLRSRVATGGPLLKYAADKTTDPRLPNSIIYALEQCTPELSLENCSNCLKKAIERIPRCSGKIGCRVLQPSCNLRYETYPFFVPAEGIPQPPPPPPSLPSPPEGNGYGNRSNKTRIIIIVVFASIVGILSVVGILSLVVCIWIYLRRKKPRDTVESK